MKPANNGRGTTYDRSNDDRRHYSQPVAIIPNDQPLYEQTPLLQHSSSTLSKSSSPTKRMLLSCQPAVNNSPWRTNEYLHSSSPMVSGHRNSLRLPNLDLREARRQSAIAAANAVPETGSVGDGWGPWIPGLMDPSGPTVMEDTWLWLLVQR